MITTAMNTGTCAICGYARASITLRERIPVCNDCFDYITDTEEDEHPLTRANTCDMCFSAPIAGVLWHPDYPSIDKHPGVQCVERCDTCERYPNDMAAAVAVSAAYNLSAVVVFDDEGEYDHAAVCKPGCEPLRQLSLFKFQ